MKKALFISFLIIISIQISAQELSDSAKVATTLEEMFTACNSSEPEEGSGTEQIIFDRLAPYIISMSKDDRKRKKMAADYNIPYERRNIDVTGKIIKKWLDEFNYYKIKSYSTQTKDNGEYWHALEVVFDSKEKTVTKIFAFIKIGDSFLLGDID